MTQIFNEDGVLTPVTVLQAGPCVVTQVKTVENDGYSAVQVGFADKREKLVNKAVKGHFDKAGVSYKRYVREFRFENAEEYSVKDEIKADIFAAGDKVDATAIEYVNSTAFNARFEAKLRAIQAKEQQLNVQKIQVENRQKQNSNLNDSWKKSLDKNIQSTFAYFK